jgi:rod shape-determining protein MreB
MADIAIDLGTTNTLIHLRGEGVVLDEPSVVALEKGTRRVLAVGLDAKRMLGRTPAGVVALRPMRGGAIADVDAVDIMLQHFLERVRPKRRLRWRPTVLITAPSGITEMERRALRSGTLAAGARELYMLPEPLAAAIGAGLPVQTPRASMVVNVGGGTTEIGVIALSGLVANHSIRVAGQDLDDLIAAYIRRAHSLLIGEATAEAVKLQIGSAYPEVEVRSMHVKGRDIVSGVPRSAEINSREIRDCMRDPVQAIAGALRAALEITPPELAADIVDDGIVLTGGGVQLRGLGVLLARETQLPVRMDGEPSRAVVRGAGAVLDDLGLYRDAISA